MSSFITNNILSREEYIAAYKSRNATDFLNYRENILSGLIGLYKHRLFPTQLEALRERFEVSLQELVNATPHDIEILEQDCTLLENDDHVLTLEEQRNIVMRAHFEYAFQRLRENVQMVVNSTIYLPSVSARI
ncbi:3581_t:CDS:1 [Funneliformis geosporum]|uniref:16745_t:CDS:1 n=1 Tax=Funneliformis geosporum TaxID=1117311 RepID=A0A9W4WMD9_9GLOM|nr:16745_t:CDS:1 [Funneliformis geosporum]CAI2180901.1 3581_t:CDS:1 [Funneliformis geosporum]